MKSYEELQEIVKANKYLMTRHTNVNKTLRDRLLDDNFILSTDHVFDYIAYKDHCLTSFNTSTLYNYCAYASVIYSIPTTIKQKYNFKL